MLRWSLGFPKAALSLLWTKVRLGNRKSLLPRQGVCAAVVFGHVAGMAPAVRDVRGGADDQVVALGRRYPVLRAAAAHRVVYRTAAQNAIIGATFFVPGSDMPAMTLNQLRMVLSLAGMYGVEIGRERAVELVGVVGLGFGLRTFARSVLHATPGIGWAIKASTGFTGTVVMGLAAMRYFEKGAPASTSRVVALVRSRRR